MNYGQIISQAWKIFRQTKLLWLLGFLYFLAGLLDLDNSTSLGYACLSLFLLGVLLFSIIGEVICADGAIRGETPSFRVIWDKFKANFGRLILFFPAILVIYYLVLFCTRIILTLIYIGFGFSSNDSSLRLFLERQVSSPFVACIVVFSLYALLLHKLGIIKSVWHGITVFSMNWSKSIMLCMIIQSPVFLFYLVSWIILYSSDNSLTFQSYLQTLSLFPVILFLRIINSITNTFFSVAFLLAYYQFIKEYDYPTLKQVSPTT